MRPGSVPILAKICIQLPEFSKAKGFWVTTRASVAKPQYVVGGCHNLWWTFKSS
jgi:hypothetical protein